MKAIVYLVLMTLLLTSCTMTVREEAPKDPIRDVMNAKIDSLQECYLASLKSGDLKGPVDVRVGFALIEKRAVVVGFEDSNTNPKGFKTCLIDTIKKMKFDDTKDKTGAFGVWQPIHFSKEGSSAGKSNYND